MFPQNCAKSNSHVRLFQMQWTGPGKQVGLAFLDQLTLYYNILPEPMYFGAVIVFYIH